MFTIGEFSKITGLTVKTLRFYHEEQLLVPSFVDPQTGYRYYDVEGIQLPAAKAIVRGEPLPEECIESDSNFKLKFGGDVRIFPEPLVYFSNSLMRWAHRVLYPAVADWPIIYRISNYLKVN